MTMVCDVCDVRNYGMMYVNILNRKKRNNLRRESKTYSGEREWNEQHNSNYFEKRKKIYFTLKWCIIIVKHNCSFLIGKYKLGVGFLVYTSQIFPTSWKTVQVQVALLAEWLRTLIAKDFPRMMHFGTLMSPQIWSKQGKDLESIFRSTKKC